MTKRNGEFVQKDNKKIKLDDDIKALWGDDLDEDALEDCIKLATQVCQQEKITCTQLNNVTLLPTYSAFKQKNQLFTSTQFIQCQEINNERPSTSKFEFVPKKKAVIAEDLQNKVITLQQECKEKEGEISILRTKLQENKTNFQLEQQKLQTEMKQKLTQTERHMKSIKSELEFKNLEVVNLKQKISEITKHNIFDVSINGAQNNTTNIKQENLVVNEVNAPLKIIQPILNPVYPLKDIVSEKILNIHKRDQHFTEAKFVHSCQNVIPYLQNRSITSNVVIDRTEIDISSIYTHILKLMYCSENEINEKENSSHLNKIISTCEQFMYDLQRFLQQIKSNLRTEDILEADSYYLKYQGNGSSKDTCNERDEIGVKSSVLLIFLAEVLPYNDYLQSYICQNKPLVVEEDTSKNHINREVIAPEHSFLNLILNIIHISGEIRKANFMSKFINATIKLLINIHKSRNYDYVSDIFCKLTKEIILSRPSIEVIHKITYLFKVASQSSSFIEYLLNKSENSITSKKGLLYIKEDVCRFYTFVMLFNNSVFGLKNENFSLNVCLNLLCFMYNTFKNCHWIHHRNIKECECLPQLYKLEIEIVGRALEKYIENTKKLSISNKWSHFFKNPIATKVLDLMTFNSCEITEKYITAFSQYKDIEKKLQEDDDLIELERLSITDEVIEVSSEAFANIDF